MIRNKNLIFGSAGASSPDVDKGIQLPKIPTANLPTASAAINGFIVYDSTTNTTKICENGAWVTITTS